MNAHNSPGASTEARVSQHKDKKMTKRSMRKLTAIFEKMGVDNPGSWAESEIKEDIPQLARFLFLRQAWRLIVSEDDPSWIANVIEWSSNNSGYPTSGIGPSLERLLQAGAKVEDINEVVRVMQYNLLFNLCYLLEDPGDVEQEVEHIYWKLFEINLNDEPARVISGLHETVLSLDPTGREMRPKDDAG